MEIRREAEAVAKKQMEEMQKVKPGGGGEVEVEGRSVRGSRVFD